MRKLRLLNRVTIYVNSLLPEVPVVDGLVCEDHFTFLALPGSAGCDRFFEFWRAQGLTSLPPVQATKSQTEHVAFVQNPGETRLCEGMIGLSMNMFGESPISHFLRLYESDTRADDGKIIPGALQHIAYGVSPKRTLEDVRAELETKGVRFMTPILTHNEAGGGQMRQMFVACKAPWGPFVEIIQRTEDLPTSSRGESGEAVQNFFPDQIDELYRHYDEYSRQLAASL